jgi:hypothetical protein
MGLSEAQWKALSPSEQAEYQRQQAVIDEQRRLKREAEEALRREAEARQAREAHERVQLAYARARYGDVITVTIEGGHVAIHGKHQLYEPVRFDLVRGERKEIEFVQQGRASSRQRIDVRLSEDGHTFYFDESARDRISLISTGWDVGKTHSALNVQDTRSRSEARNLTVSIKLKELPGAPRKQEIRKP